MKTYLAIDQGTTSSRAILFDETGQALFSAQEEFTQIFPQSGWVEHDPEEIWSTVVKVSRAVLDQASQQGISVSGIGITNQRETTLIWDKKTGKAVYNAIVWQDRRTADFCQGLREAGHEQTIAARAGLVIDPYFSASKIRWILNEVPGARAAAQAGDLAFGTVESFLIWRLTDGARHISDASNAARTSLLNIKTGQWDDTLCALFEVPQAILPAVVDCAGDLGLSENALGQPLPILSAIGDQQSAAIGQACITPGSIKSTYGTGCFVILNTGDDILQSQHKLLSTVAWQLEGKRAYALEGSIFIAGAVVQWLRDSMGLVEKASQSEEIAASLADNGGVYLVPAFTGLGAPHWDADARGSVFGMTRDTGPQHFIRAALESVAYQTNDLFEAMAQDGMRPTKLRVDGGMAANSWLMQFLSDILAIPVDRPKNLETTALGAAMLAALADGTFSSLDEIAGQWQLDTSFSPVMDTQHKAELVKGWHAAVSRTRTTS